MTKTQRLRNTAEGFMAGLVANGYGGPFRHSHVNWELPFYRAWGRWPPARRDPMAFPRFEVGGHGRTSQARELLWELKRTSPFANYASEPLPRTPRGLSITEYLDTWVEGAAAEEWIALAGDFLTEIGANHSEPS